MQDSYRQGWVGTLGGILFIIIIISLTVELNFLDYALQRPRLLGFSLKVGIAISFLAGLIIWDWESWPQLSRIKAIAIASFFCLIIGGWFTLLSNRLGIYLRKSESATLTLVEETARYADRFGQLADDSNRPADRYLTTFLLKGVRYQMSVEEPLFPGSSPGDQVVREVGWGLWGYKYILPPK